MRSIIALSLLCTMILSCVSCSNNEKKSDKKKGCNKCTASKIELSV